jgi:hypothetical protein
MHIQVMNGRLYLLGIGAEELGDEKKEEEEEEVFLFLL